MSAGNRGHPHPRVLVTGGKGMLGIALVERLSGQAEVLAVDIDRLDVTDRQAVRSQLAGFRPELVIHCAAMTDVDGCERDPVSAHRVNAGGAEAVARECAESGVVMVHVSTDFVFDGRKREPYTEDDEPSPISVYGSSKLEGEGRVRACLAEHIVVRTAWTFAPWGHNFVRSILKGARERGALRVVDDQTGSPTYALDLADGIWRLSRTRAYGTYHLTNAGVVSRYEFARRIISEAGMEAVPVTPISSAELHQPALRPEYSALASRRLTEAGVTPLRHHRAALAECIGRLQTV